jgi:hypothetical protein
VQRVRRLDVDMEHDTSFVWVIVDDDDDDDNNMCVFYYRPV